MPTDPTVSLAFVVSDHIRMAQYMFVHTPGELCLRLYLCSYTRNELCYVQRYTRKGAVNQGLLPVPHGFVSSNISLFFRYKKCESAAMLK